MKSAVRIAIVVCAVAGLSGGAWLALVPKPLPVDNNPIKLVGSPRVPPGHKVVLRAAQDLPAGSIGDEGPLEIVNMDEKELPEGAFTFASLWHARSMFFGDGVNVWRLQRPIRAGEVVGKADMALIRAEIRQR